MTELQQGDLGRILTEFKDILSDLPNLTHLAQHGIHLTTADPIRNKPYQIPFALSESVNNEIKKMIKMDIIKPSESSYGSFIVVAKKADGSKRK